ncbi:MAG: hypothetical protein WEB09_06475 [Nitriliruptor sp.]
MWSDLFEHCAEVGGPVHVHVAADISGLTVNTVRGRAGREGWWQPYRDVVAPPGTPIDGRTRALAAIVRAQGPDRDAPAPVALTRWSGAAAHDVRSTWPTRVQVVVPFDRMPVRGAKLEVVRSRNLDPDRDIEVVGTPGLAVLRPPALVRGLAAVVDVPTLTDLVIDLVQQRRMTLEDVLAGHLASPCYPGRPKVTEVLRRLGADGRTDSTLERRLRRGLVADGIPLDRGQVEVPCLDGRSLHLDLGIARICFGIEATSMKAHSERSQLRDDARRANQLARVDDDWRVLQATWEDLDSAAFRQLVREVVAAQSLRHLGRPWPV